ncbi:MAG: hypothetical protein M5R36_02365 [Deltaproteobacteria bacterium]|nr:hypothetical protein [Deltaproteobacteria bacterium]
MFAAKPRKAFEEKSDGVEIQAIPFPERFGLFDGRFVNENADGPNARFGDSVGEHNFLFVFEIPEMERLFLRFLEKPPDLVDELHRVQVIDLARHRGGRE